MSKGSFSRSELIGKCNEFLTDKPSELYKQSFITSCDTVKGESGSERTDVIAEYICGRIDDLERIQCLSRESYKIASHIGTLTESNQEEKNLAKELFNQCKSPDRIHRTPYDFIGVIIDYETPLKTSNEDKGVGKIDLLSVSDDEPCVYLLELKKQGSHESLLRCVLEAYTYSKQVDSGRLKSSFDIPENYDIKPTPLVSKNGAQWKEMQELKNGKKPHLKELMERLKIAGPFYYEMVDGKYVITID